MCRNESKLEVTVGNETISGAAYHVTLQFKIAVGSDWQLVSILLSPYGVSSLCHCKMESCVEVNEFIVTSLDG